MLEIAPRGLAQMYRPSQQSFAHTARLTTEGGEWALRAEGLNIRYDAIAALGLHQLPLCQQRTVLAGQTAPDLASRTARRADRHPDPGGAALAAWAAAEVSGRHEEGLFQTLERAVEHKDGIATTTLAWILTAALAARDLGDTGHLIDASSALLLASQGPSGLYPHQAGRSPRNPIRAHVGSFADQVYPIQALARLAAATGHQPALDAANACAQRICAQQGHAGQWWWHYDARNGSVVEGYPVYSVHQHAMAPMTLGDLLDAGGLDARTEITRGVDWLIEHPEVDEELISDRCAVIWRKVGRREPRKAVRAIAATSTAIHAGMRVPGLDLLFPPGRVDHECRPYELGWLLYAWLSRPNSNSATGTVR